MKKYVAMLLSLAMCLCMFAGCVKQNEDPGETSPLATLEVTEAPKTEMELALDSFISKVQKEKVIYEGLSIAYEGKYVYITPADSLDALADMVFGISAEVEDGVDTSIFERYDPNVAGLKERLSYKRVIDLPEYRGHYWQFTADVSSVTESIKWMQLDPLVNYDGSDAISINGIGLSTPISDVLLGWGTPDYAGVDVKEGAEVVILRWDYDMSSPEGKQVSVYVCFNVGQGTNIESSVVYNIYANFEATVN